MDVKRTGAKGSQADNSDARADHSDIETDLSELLRVMPGVFRGLRRDAEGGDSPAAAFKELFKQGALGPRHIPVLVVLALDGPQTVGDLARRLSLSLATVSLMVGELDRAGLVERREDEQDRRRTVVRLAERHRRRLAPIIDQRIAPLRRALEQMPPEVRAGFLAGWRVLAEEIERSRTAGS